MKRTAASGAAAMGRGSWAIAAGLGIILLVLIGLGWWSAVHDSIPEVSLPILAIAGIVGLLLAIAVVSIAFAAFGLSDRTKALALPDGSVRAVIALSLLVLFAILSVFLYVSLSSEKEIATNLSAGEVKSFTDKLTPEQQNDVTSRVTGAAADKTPTYSLFLRDTTSQARQDIAKQLLGIIGTLLSAIAGFYFGANTVSSTIAKTNLGGGGNAGNAGNGYGGGGGGNAAGGGDGEGSGVIENAAALKTLSAAIVPAGGALRATREAAQLGQDPRLASESDPQKQNRGIVY